MAAITGTVYFDTNLNQTQDTFEPGLANRLVQVFNLIDLVNPVGQATTDASGNYAVDMTGQPNTPYTVVCSPPAPWQPTTPTNVPVDGPDATVNFGQQKEVCQGVVSRWVRKVCFVPGAGVKVTFRSHKQGLFACIYPGTTYLDYLGLLAAPSKGHAIDSFYYRRPYYPVPPSA